MQHPSLAVVGIDHLNIEFVYTDEGSIIIAAGETPTESNGQENELKCMSGAYIFFIYVLGWMLTSDKRFKQGAEDC